MLIDFVCCHVLVIPHKPERWEGCKFKASLGNIARHASYKKNTGKFREFVNS